MTEKAVGLLASVFLTGCAFGNRTVTLTYPPGGTVVENAVRQNAAKVPRSGKVVLVQFLDQRSKKSVVGEVHNGYGMHTADAVAANSVPTWVMSAIELELIRQGFEILKSPDIPAASDSPIVTGAVLTVMCEAYTHFESTVEFSVIVSTHGNVGLTKSYKGVDESVVNWTAAKDVFAHSLSLALHIAADNFAVELRRLSQLMH